MLTIHTLKKNLKKKNPENVHAPKLVQEHQEILS